VGKIVPRVEAVVAQSVKPVGSEDIRRVTDTIPLLFLRSCIRRGCGKDGGAQTADISKMSNFQFQS